MKRIALAVIAVMVFVSSAYAAVSSPCGARKPAPRPAAPAPACEPRSHVERGFSRDVLDNRVPTQTVRKGNVSEDMRQATQDRDTLISGRK